MPHFRPTNQLIFYFFIQIERGKLFCKRPEEKITQTGFEALTVGLEDTDSRAAPHGVPLTKLSILPTLLDRVRTLMAEGKS